MPNPVTTPPESPKSLELPHFSSIALIGAGMIGASLAKSIVIPGLPSASRCSSAMLRGWPRSSPRALPISPPPSRQRRFKVLSFVLLCTNVAAYAGLARRLAPHLATQAIIPMLVRSRRACLKRCRRCSILVVFRRAPHCGGRKNRGQRRGLSASLSGAGAS